MSELTVLARYIARFRRRIARWTTTTGLAACLAVAATGTAAVTAFSTIQDWKIAAIVAGVILVAGAATAFYFWRLRKDRKMMHEADIA